MKKMNTPQKILAGLIFISLPFTIGLIILAFLFNLQPAYADTTYSSPPPTSVEEISMTGNCCSGADNYKEYGTHFTVPVGVTFDRMQLSGSIVSGNPYVVVSLMREATTTNYAYNAFYGNVSDLLGLQDDTTVLSYSVPLIDLGDGRLLSDSFTPITIPSTSHYLSVYLTNGSFTVARNMQFESGMAYRVNLNGDPSNYTIREAGQAIQLCDGFCTNNLGFNPIPEVTATPWITMPYPQDGATVGYNTNFQIQANTGTTSADNVLVTFNSTNQTIVPYSFNLVVTGLTVENFLKQFPTLNDTITVKAYLRASTTVIAETATTTLYIQESIDDSAEQCAQFGTLMGGLCSLFVFLIVPDDGTFNDFIDIWDDIKLKPPFGYIVVIIEQLGGVDDSVTPAFSIGVIPFMDAIFTPLRDNLGFILWGIYAIYFYRHKLSKMDI